LNHRKKTKAGGSRLIPRKHTETLALLNVHNHESTTVIVAQSPTSNHSVLKKCFVIENNGKKLSENKQKQTKGDFHCLEVHIKIMTISKGSRHSLSQPNKTSRQSKLTTIFFAPSVGKWFNFSLKNR